MATQAEIAVLRGTATQVKNESQVGGNTAGRVGGLFEGIVDALPSDEVIDGKISEAVADIQPIEITGDVTNAPDEEDLTSENQGGTDVLKFKDKAYNSALYSGLGRVYLRKNIVTLEGTGKNVLTQAMVNTANTIYHIQYDYDLNGQTITLPVGCVLKFDGGSLNNGTLIGANTKLDNCSFYNVNFSGIFECDIVKVSWFRKHTDKDSIIQVLNLAHICTGKTVDFERIEKSFSGTIIISETQDANWLNANFIYTPTKDYDVAFKFFSNTVWKGGGKYIKDSEFKCISSTTYIGVSCLLYERWYNDSGSLWENIHVDNFTGYFLINCGNYSNQNSWADFQQVALRDVMCYKTGGLLSYNTDKYYSEYSGGSNIVLIENCSCNGSTSDEKYNGITSVIDLSDCKEVTFLNCTFQGTITSNRCILRVRMLPTGVVGYPVITFDGFWCEYTNYSNTEKQIVLESGASLVNRGKWFTNGIDIKHDNTCIRLHNYYGTTFKELLDGIRIAEGVTTVSIDIDTSLITETRLTSIDISKWTKYIEEGIVFNIKNSVSSSTIGTSTNYKNSIFDIKGQINKIDGISTIFKDNLISNNGQEISLRYENGCHILKLERQTERGSVASIRFSPWNYFHPNLDKKGTTIITDIIYRVAPLVDITEENKNNVKYPTLTEYAGWNAKTFEVGTRANQFTEWVRNTVITPIRFIPSNWMASYLDCSQSKIEFAKLDVYENQCIFDSNIFISTDGLKVYDMNDTNSIKCYVKDVTLDSIKTHIQDCINTMFRLSDGLFYVSNNGIFKLDNNLNKGDTNNRPVSSIIGSQYFDTTLGKPIWWNGSAWVDATGVPAADSKKIVAITESDYQALATKDSNTL